MISGKIDISIDRDNRGQFRFYLPIDHLISDDEITLQTIIQKGYWPSRIESMELDKKKVAEIKRENLQNLFTDTIRSQKSTIDFNHRSARHCIPDPKAQNEEKEHAECLSQFNHFLESQLREGTAKILLHYQQGLINFPGNLIFKALAKYGHTLKEKKFNAHIECNVVNHFLPTITTRIEQLNYIPQGKDLFDKNSIVNLPGYLETRLQFFEEKEKCGFNLILASNSPYIVALILGNFHNSYVDFLQHYLMVKQRASWLLEKTLIWLNQHQDLAQSPKEATNTSAKKIVSKYFMDFQEVKKVFEQMAVTQGELDILLATQDTPILSPWKLKKDNIILNTNEKCVNRLTFFFKEVESEVLNIMAQETERRRDEEIEMEILKDPIAFQRMFT